MYLPQANWKKSWHGLIDSSIELIRLAAAFTHPLVKQTVGSCGLGFWISFGNQGGCRLPGYWKEPGKKPWNCWKVSAGVKTEKLNRDKWKRNKVKTTRHLQIGLSKPKAREEKQPAAYYLAVAFLRPKVWCNAPRAEAATGKATRSWNWFWSETRWEFS